MRAILTICLLLAAAAAQAQTGPPAKQVRHLVRLVPQEFIVNTFRADWEIRTGNRASVQISPSITAAEHSFEYERIFGGGLELQRKFYLRQEEVSLKGFYGGITASFHRYNLSEDEYYYFDYTTGTSYYAPREENVNRFAANLALGYQFIFKEVVALDLYAGGGIRIASSDHNRTNYSYSLFDPRYNGIAPKLGFSIGVVL